MHRRLIYASIAWQILHFIVIIKGFYTKRSRYKGSELPIELQKIYARHLLAKKDYEKLYKAISKFFDKYPTSFDSGTLINSYLKCLIWMGLYDDAWFFIEKKNLIDSKNPYILLSIAEIMRNQGEFLNAIDMIEYVNKVKPDCLMRPIEMIKTCCCIVMSGDSGYTLSLLEKVNNGEISGRKKIIKRAESELNEMENIVKMKHLHSNHFPILREAKARVLLCQSALLWEENDIKNAISKAQMAVNLIISTLMMDISRPELNLFLAYILSISSLSSISAHYHSQCVKTLCPWFGNEYHRKAMNFQVHIQEARKKEKVLSPLSLFYLYSKDPWPDKAFIYSETDYTEHFRVKVFEGVRIFNLSLKNYNKISYNLLKNVMKFYFYEGRHNVFGLLKEDLMLLVSEM